MKKQTHLKRIAIAFCIILGFLSVMTMAEFKGIGNNDPFQEIWLKLWKKGGGIVDLRFQICRIGGENRFATATRPLEIYPFQFDLSDLGNVSADDIKGIVYGYKIKPDGQTESPLMIRWWIAAKNRLDPKDPIPPRYPLTLKLRVWDAAGVEFNPREQQASLFERNGIPAESASIL